jgi:hypothetical protein
MDMTRRTTRPEDGLPRPPYAAWYGRRVRGANASTGLVPMGSTIRRVAENHSLHGGKPRGGAPGALAPVSLPIIARRGQAPSWRMAIDATSRDQYQEAAP